MVKDLGLKPFKVLDPLPPIEGGKSNSVAERWWHQTIKGSEQTSSSTMEVPLHIHFSVIRDHDIFDPCS